MLTRKTKYALKALLVLAEEHGKGPVLMADLAGRGKAPRKFLESILQTLKVHGLVDSKRGKHGGYFLGRPPQAITLAEVIRLLDGPLALVPCASLTAYRRCSDCVDEQTCGIRLVMKDVRDATAHILDATTLTDVLQRVRELAGKK